MIGDRQLFIGFFNLVGTGVFLDAQYFVIVPFSSHRNHISGDLDRSRNTDRGLTNGPPLPVARGLASNCTPRSKSPASPDSLPSYRMLPSTFGLAPPSVSSVRVTSTCVVSIRPAIDAAL